jgi:hypothetical protein
LFVCCWWCLSAKCLNRNHKRNDQIGPSLVSAMYIWLKVLWIINCQIH